MNYKVGTKYKIVLESECVPTFQATYDDLLLNGILSYNDALKQDDIITKHNSITSRKAFNVNIKMMTFLKFETKQGTPLIIAEEYINSSEALTTLDLLITITSINSSDISTIKKALDGLGFLDAKYDTKSLG